VPGKLNNKKKIIILNEKSKTKKRRSSLFLNEKSKTKKGNYLNKEN